jgi:hypothetical protein
MALSPEDHLVSVAAGKTNRRRAVARPLYLLAFPRIAVLLAAFALVAQLTALPYHHPQSQSDVSSVAATLKATFGDAAVLCVQADGDSSSNTPERHHQGHCDDGCPLCQFAAQTVLFVAVGPTLPARVGVPAAPLMPLADFGGTRTRPTGFAQARAPPIEV